MERSGILVLETYFQFYKIEGFHFTYYKGIGNIIPIPTNKKPLF